MSLHSLLFSLDHAEFWTSPTYSPTYSPPPASCSLKIRVSIHPCPLPMWRYILVSSPPSCSLKLGFGSNSIILSSHLDNDFFFIQSSMISSSQCYMVLIFNLLINSYIYKLWFGWNSVILSSSQWFLQRFLGANASLVSSPISWLIHICMCVYIQIRVQCNNVCILCVCIHISYICTLYMYIFMCLYVYVNEWFYNILGAIFYSRIPRTIRNIRAFAFVNASIILERKTPLKEW